MTPLTALLCLGLSVGAGTPMRAGPLPRAPLWAEPGNVVANRSSVTIWCKGTPGVQKYLLKGGESAGLRTVEMSLESGDKAKHHIDHVGPDAGGLYTCEHCNTSGCSSVGACLDLVVTGLYSKPSLAALLSPVVASGGTVTLQCSSSERFHGFVLTQEGEPQPLYLKSQAHPSGQTHALFSVGPVVPGHQWTFRCYGHFEDPMLRSHPSDPLQLLLSDTSGRPSLLSLQGPIATPGQNLTLHCSSQVGYDRFALSKEGAQDLLQRPGQQPQPGLSQADFLLGPINGSHRGRYRCYGGHGLSPVWWEPSDPLDILVAGQDCDTPILSVQPGSQVSPGKNVTLQCLSKNYTNIFLLTKEGTADPPLRVSTDGSNGLTQARFFFHPVTSAHGGTYRCYRSCINDPYQLSHPSEPLQLSVLDPPLPPIHPQDYTVKTLGWVLLGVVILLLLGILFLRFISAREGRRTIRSTQGGTGT